MRDSPQQKLRLKDRRRRLMWVKVAAGSAVVALSLIAVWFVFRLPEVTIASVEVTGTKSVSADTLKALVEEKLNGAYAFFIPHRNSLVFPKGDIERAVANAFPLFAHVSISRNGFTGITLAVEDRVAVARWCEGTGPQKGTDTSATCYDMDKDGFVFAPASTATPSVQFYGALSGTTPIGSTYIHGSFASLNSLVGAIASTVKRIPATVVVDTGSNDVDLAFTDGGVVKFVRTPDQQATLANIASVFASQSFKTNKEFEYVDFRFGDKVYVKFKGE